MAASNTVEAVLLGKFEDSISRGVSSAQNALTRAFSDIQNAGAALSAGLTGIWESALMGLRNWQAKLRQSASESDSAFGKIGLSAAAMAVAVAIAAAKVISAAVSMAASLIKSSGEALEARVAFESLAGGADKASAMLRKLKEATEGQVSGTLLMQNANRVIQSHVMTAEQASTLYVQLTANVFRLAKAAGVDGTQALDALTNAVIRGNARGFQAIGLHLAVKDAVSEMAGAMGQSANTLSDHSKLQAFYAELLKKSTQALAANGTEVRTVEDALKTARTTWSGFLTNLGVAVQRSEVLQQFLAKLNEKLLDMGKTGPAVDQVALAVNSFVISALQGLATTAEVLGWFSVAWNTIWAAVRIVATGVTATVASALWVIQQAIASTFTLASKMPGVFGEAFRQWAIDTQGAADKLSSLARGAGGAFVDSFKGIGDGQAKAAAFAERIRGLASALEQYRGGVLAGAAGTQQFGDDAGGAAENVKKLAEETKAYLAMRKQLTPVSGEQAIWAEYFETANKIMTEFAGRDVKTVERRNELLKLADLKRLADMRKLADAQMEVAAEGARAIGKEMDDQGRAESTQAQAGMAEWLATVEHGEARINEILMAAAKEREDRRRAEAQNAVQAANAIIQTISMAQSGKLPARMGAEAQAGVEQTMQALQRSLDVLRAKPLLNEEQISEVERLRAALEKLNQLKMTPFQKMLQNLKEGLKEWAAQSMNAWANFWQGMVEGQKNGGKQFVAALVSTIGDMLVALAVKEMAEGFAAWTTPPIMLKHFAAAAAIAALGGTLKGVAGLIGGTSQASGSSSSAGANSAASSTQQVQIINVGAPSGPQNVGQAVRNSEPEIIEVRLAPPAGWVADQAIKEIRRNNTTFRLALKKAVGNA